MTFYCLFVKCSMGTDTKQLKCTSPGSGRKLQGSADCRAQVGFLASAASEEGNNNISKNSCFILAIRKVLMS